MKPIAKFAEVERHAETKVEGFRLEDQGEESWSEFSSMRYEGASVNSSELAQRV
jgi:hypothetical protein